MRANDNEGVKMLNPGWKKITRNFFKCDFTTHGISKRASKTAHPFPKFTFFFNSWKSTDIFTHVSPSFLTTNGEVLFSHLHLLSTALPQNVATFSLPSHCNCQYWFTIFLWFISCQHTEFRDNRWLTFWDILFIDRQAEANTWPLILVGAGNCSFEIP